MHLEKKSVDVSDDIPNSSRVSLLYLFCRVLQCIISWGVKWLHRKIVFVLVNVAVQLDREAQRHPCLKAPGGREEQLRGTHCAQVCRGGSLAAGSWRAGRELWHSEAGQRCIEQESHGKCNTHAHRQHWKTTSEFICVLNISCYCGNTSASLCKICIKEL